jgi:hypothetical protein
MARWAYESSLPPDKREGITDESLKTRKEALGRQQSVDIGLDTARLIAGLQEAVDVLGPQHEIVKTLTGGKTPEQAAKELLAATKFNGEEFRKQLMDGGNAAIEASKDPVVAMARAIEAKARPLRRQLEESVTAVISEHSQRIAEARFAIQGKSLYPDATNTLRLTYGPIATYPANGTLMQPFTPFHGLVDRYEGWGGNQAGADGAPGAPQRTPDASGAPQRTPDAPGAPQRTPDASGAPQRTPDAEGGQWTLPQRWLDRLPTVNMSTPYNFVYACDTVGGNSGSPVIDTRGELVGLNFDSNMEGQAGYYVYDGSTKRSIAVDARAITEALSKVMDGGWIVEELIQ